MKIAFLFPGQGSQFAGMGKELAEAHTVARQTMKEADDVLGFSLSHLCYEGPEEDLRRTENTQPALVATSVAAWRVLEANGEAQPDFVAGHSLGEYSALVAAGALRFADALRLVRLRGQFMQEAVPEGVGAMAAILKMPFEKLGEVLAEAAQGEIVSAANLNSPDQIVIAGHQGAVARAMELAKAAGAKRCVLLPVSAPFHCALMRPAQDKMRPALEATEFADLRVPLVNNVAAEIITTGAAAREGLIEQIPNAVRWVESVERIKKEGVTSFREVGAGKVLTGLVRQIASDLTPVS
ncbi:MAG: ACP S-malonyltransferase [Bryobacter sp.]|nr:ACP S-malonyltransferase [Bryobacter sp.]